MLRTFTFYKIIILALVSNAFSDATVVQSGSPTFPLQVDNVTLSAHRGPGKKRDSATVRLPVSLYAEVRDNIDTIFTYADALMRHRQELAQQENADRPSLTFEYMGICVMRIFLSDDRCKSGKLVASEDRYPFVVVFSKGFSARLKKLIKTYHLFL